MSFRKKTTRIHTGLGLMYPNTSRLYYYLRSRVESGCGWLTIDLKHLMLVFKRSESTIKRWLKDGLKQEFFQAVEFKKKKGVYVKLFSFKKLKNSVEQIHSSGVTDINNLMDINLFKLRLYQIAVLIQQQRSSKAIVNKKKKLWSPPIKKIQRSAKFAKGCAYISYKQKTPICFVSLNQEPPGASQITLGLILNKSTRTLNRWCKKLPHLQVYKRVKKANTKLPGYYYVHKKSRYTIIYRRYPCFYLPNELANLITISPEKYNAVIPPHIKQFEEGLQLEADFDYLKKVKKPRLTKWEDYLLFNFTHDKLLILANAIVKHFMGKDVDFNSFNLSTDQLVSAIVNGIKTLDSDQQLFCRLMTIRMLGNKSPIPLGLIERQVVLPRTYELALLDF